MEPEVQLNELLNRTLNVTAHGCPVIAQDYRDLALFVTRNEKG
jgi:hypothetical protein